MSVCEFVCELGECGVFAEVVILELELELFWRKCVAVSGVAIFKRRLRELVCISR